MKKELFMGVDLGTSFIKVGVFDLDGNCIVITKEGVRSEQPAPDQFLQKGEELYASVVRCIRKANEEIALNIRNKTDVIHIEAIAFTGQMAGVIGVAKDWGDITGWSCSLDTRYIPYADRLMKKFSNDFLDISGTNSPLLASKYAWLKGDFPDKDQKIAKYMMISSYIIGRLGNLSVDDAVIDGSLITWTGLADVKHRMWSKDLCDKVGIPIEKLPRITESTDIVAYLSKEAATLTGLQEGIPLVSGAGDKVAGCVGAGNLHPGDMLFEDASFGAVSCMVQDFRSDEEKRHFDILNGCKEGDFYAHYYIPGSGITREWFLNQFFKKDEETLADAYQRMETKLEKVPLGSDGIYSTGMLGGTVMPFNGFIKGIWMGYTWSHRAEHFYKALIESFAYSMATTINRIDTMYPNYRERRRIRVIGGGTASKACLQIYADVIGIPLETIEQENATLWGACILAAKGVDMIDNIKDFAVKHIINGSTFIPNKDNTEAYCKYINQYNKYIEELTPFCKNQIH